MKFLVTAIAAKFVAALAAVRCAAAQAQGTATTKTCVVPSHNDSKTDDSDSILSALRSCNNGVGGRVLFSPDVVYTVAKAMDLTFLKDIHVEIAGTVRFTDDTDYWQANAFPLGFQNATSFFKLGGSGVEVSGGGTLDGNGQVWYDLYARDIYAKRPVLVALDGLHNSTIRDLHLVNSPFWFHLVANSTDVTFSGITIDVASTSSNPAKNGDGWDTYRSSHITIRDSQIHNSDDCVSFKPNSTFITVKNLVCVGSHGVSVGSLGQYPGETDIVEHIYVHNVTMIDATYGARIKTWPGLASELSGELQGGGGLGRVHNITYKSMHVHNVTSLVLIDQCYGQSNVTLCEENPVSLPLASYKPRPC